jgi:hypothetical protein
MPSSPAPWTRIRHDASIYRKHLRSPSPEASWTAWREEEEIFPDPVSASIAESWRSGAAKALERQFAAVVETEPVKS